MYIRDKRIEKRFFIDNVIIREYGPKIGPYGIAVYCALCMHANIDSQKCWPGMRLIAEEIGASIGKVHEAVHVLEELKLIDIKERYHENGGQTSNMYTLLTPPSLREHPPIQNEHPPIQGERNNPKLTILKEQDPPTAEQVPVSFQEWRNLIKENKNKTAIVMRMYHQLYADGEEVEYGRVGACAKRVGGWGRLAQLLWETSTRPPIGDVFSYLQAIHKANGPQRRRLVPKDLTPGRGYEPV